MKHGTTQEWNDPETDSRSQPQAFAIRSVKTLVRVQRIIESTKTSRQELSLTFDSFSAAAYADARSVRIGERHLVYQSPAMTLDLTLEGDRGRTALTVRGQLLGADARPLPNVQAFLLEGDRIHSQDLSGRAGDFRLLGEVDTSPQLCLLVENESLVELELPGLLDQTSTAPTH